MPEKNSRKSNPAIINSLKVPNRYPHITLRQNADMFIVGNSCLINSHNSLIQHTIQCLIIPLSIINFLKLFPTPPATTCINFSKLISRNLKIFEYIRRAFYTHVTTQNVKMTLWMGGWILKSSPLTLCCNDVYTSFYR